MLKVLFLSMLFISCNNRASDNVADKKEIKSESTYAADNCWSVAGSTGIADDDAVGKLNMGSIRPPLVTDESNPPNQLLYEDMSVHIKPAFFPGKYSIRYPCYPESFYRKKGTRSVRSISGSKFQATYKLSNPKTDKVTVYLMEWDRKSNSVKIIATIESGLWEEPNKYVSQFVQLPDYSFDKTYYLKVILETTKLKPLSVIITNESEGPSLGSIEFCDWLR